MNTQDWQAFALTLQLAGVSTFLLLLLGTPLAWWLATTASRWRGFVFVATVLPLVLPPTVIGFYLLLLLGPQGWAGKFIAVLGLAPLPFSFTGLVLASMLYSLPFVVQPVQAAFEAVGKPQLEAAATLGAGAATRFFRIVLPQSWTGLVAAAVLGFSHTVGEFGMALMVGGNIPGRTRLASMAIYDKVEAGRFDEAHVLSLLLVAFSFSALMALTWLRPKRRESA